uniref:Sorting nexin n=1 Tax=Petromyzon marinus TaxID=7757 RepID=S4R4U7_PETMA
VVIALSHPPDYKTPLERGRSVSIDLQGEPALRVSITDAVSERDRVLFTVCTKTILPAFKNSKVCVSRQHEDFVWLHDSYVENGTYAGFIIPPAPLRPDFSASRDKLHRLGQSEGTMTKEEFSRMKQEVEAEYLVVFKKTVAMHEGFLVRLATHPVLSQDSNLQVFLEYTHELNVRGKNKKEMLGGFFRNVVKSADELVVSGVEDIDEFMEHEKVFLVDYHLRIKDATTKADKMTKAHKNIAEDYLHISASFTSLATQDSRNLSKLYLCIADVLEKTRKLEGRAASDQDLKLSDLFRYYMKDSQAAKDLLYRRTRALVDYENANKALDRARTRNKDVAATESQQQTSLQRFEKLSSTGKQELKDFRCRRVLAFRKGLVELTELQLKHCKANLQVLQICLGQIQDAN